MAAKKATKNTQDSKVKTAKKSVKSRKQTAGTKAVAESQAASSKAADPKTVETKASENKPTLKGVRKESTGAAAPRKVARPLPRPVEKSKLDLDEETKRLLDARRRNKASHPEFRREDSHKKDLLRPGWRKPRGLHSQLRIHRKAKGAVVKIGYGSPAAVSGFHPSGYKEVLVYKPEDVRKVGKNEAIRVGGTVGRKKQEEIEKLAKELNVKVLNPLNVFEEVQ